MLYNVGISNRMALICRDLYDGELKCGYSEGRDSLYCGVSGVEGGGGGVKVW